MEIQLPVYTVPWDAATAVTTAIDAFELKAASTCGLALLRVKIDQVTEVGDAAEEKLNWTVALWVGATSGSGGTTSTPQRTRSGGTAAAFTAEIRNTTQATGSGGSLTVVHRDAFEVRQGLDFVWTPDSIITCKASEALIVAVSAPADSTTMTATAYVAELR